MAFNLNMSNKQESNYNPFAFDLTSANLEAHLVQDDVEMMAED